MRLVSILVTLGVLSACADETQRLLVNIEGVKYELPASRVPSYTRAPYQFIRINVPGEPYDIVHDSRLARKTIDGWPLIFSLNDGAATNVEYIRSGRHMVVCRRASAPEGGCGLTIEDAGVTWFLLFPYEQLESADQLQSRASEQLKAWRSGEQQVVD